MSSNTCLLGFSEYEQQAKAIAAAAAIDYAQVDIHRFPDGESKIFLPVNLPERVIVCRSLNQPNKKLIEILLVAAAAKQQGVKNIILLAPYLCYMRQDMAFNPGEIVSQKIIGKMLADYFDTVITVDAHLHRIEKLSQAIPLEKAINLTATQPMTNFLRQQFKRPFLLGPDAESKQWVSAIAQQQGFDFAVASKQRLGDRHVDITLPDVDFSERDVVLVDDMASSGRTLEVAASLLKPHKPASINVLVTHALFMGDAVQRLQRHGIQNIWSCDSVPHETNSISLAKIFAENLREIKPQ